MQSCSQWRRWVARGVLLLGVPLLLVSCATVDPADEQAWMQQDLRIAAEPPGDYWVGRRWWTEGTRYWGYVRRPRQPWAEAKLVVMGERNKLNPDRIPADSPGPRQHGYDHNHEYQLWGSYSGESIYDPNSNLILPEFVLREYELISASPGFLFHPKERYNPKAIAPKYPGREAPARR